MIHWITFDEQTVTAIDNRMGAGSAQLQSGGPLSIALNLTSASILVIPSAMPDKAVVLHLRPVSQSPGSKATFAFEPSGFLGLSGAAVLLDEMAPAKKHWWQRSARRWIEPS